MIKNAIRLYFTQNHTNSKRDYAIKRASKLFQSQHNDIELIYNQWRKDYTKNIINTKGEMENV